MDFTVFFFIFLLWGKENFVGGVKFSSESLGEIPMLVKEGKTHLESLLEKSNVPQFGPCWKNAVSNLKTTCKFLSEDVQSDLALKFADCFFQMSGHEPLKCNTQKSVCLKKLSDRAFNVYTEFYTHTQSICYFLQSQVWHEETEKTINKLSSTAVEVSQKLEKAEKSQEQLLQHQKESLYLQKDLVDSSETVKKFLESSQDRINLIMKDFQESAEKQKELLINVFEHLLSFKEFVVDELSWFNSTLFFIAATVLSFLFTSVARTKQARILLFIIFTVNFLFERYLTSSFSTNINFVSNLASSTEALNSSIWLCRKFCSCISVLILLYFAFNYCDYNFINYKLLLEIKNQNLMILNHFSSKEKIQPPKSKIDTVNYNNFNSTKWTESKKMWFQGCENNKIKFLNSNNSFFSLQGGCSPGLVKNYKGDFEYEDSASKHHCNITEVDGLSFLNKNYKNEKISDDVLITSEKIKSFNSPKKHYDLRVKKKTVYAF